MASMFRNFFQSKAPSTQVSPKVEELYAEATKAYQAKDFSRAIPLYERVIELQPDHAEAYYKRGNALKDLGQLAAAVASYDAALERKPDFQYAWCNRGAVQQSLGLPEAALASFDQAVKLDPNDILAHANRSSLLQAMSRWQEALASHDRVLALNPQLFQVWFLRGNVLRELGQLTAALASHQEAVKLKPDYVEALYNCGVLLERAQQPHAALASYDRAIEIYPGFHQAHYNRAGVLKELKQLQPALDAYDRAIAAKADYAEAHANRGVVLQELERLDEALASCNRAIALRPDYAQYYLNRSTILKEQKQWDAALVSCEQAVALRPEYADVYVERGTILGKIGRHEEARADYDRAIALKPDFAEAQYNRSLALLLSGDYENGWRSHEWRWPNADKLRMDGRRTFSQPLWLGEESLAGKRLLVYAEQGLGDTIQFCRFAKSAADLGASVILEVQARLAGLMTSLQGVSQVVVEESPLPEFDYRCPMMSLPLAVKNTLDTIPGASGYLRADPEKVAAWRARLGERRCPRIGLVWSGNAKQGNDRHRSFRLARWIEHLPRHFQYFCLQKEVRPEDQVTLAANPWIAFDEQAVRDFDETAALCESLDLVISVCTSIAHLSGALGRPTWILLPFSADWRWLIGRDDSPWYRSAKLYRQQAIGDWNGVFTRVAADLRKTFP
jgi:tetratricopeptide (TPR) repeat protein